MRYQVEEVEDGDNNKIVIRLTGDDVSFLVSSNAVSIYLDKKTADSIAFHLYAITEDMDRRKTEEKA